MVKFVFTSFNEFYFSIKLLFYTQSSCGGSMYKQSRNRSISNLIHKNTSRNQSRLHVSKACLFTATDTVVVWWKEEVEEWQVATTPRKPMSDPQVYRLNRPAVWTIIYYQLSTAFVVVADLWESTELYKTSRAQGNFMSTKKKQKNHNQFTQTTAELSPLTLFLTTSENRYWQNAV